MEPGTPEAVAILALALEHSGRLGTVTSAASISCSLSSLPASQRAPSCASTASRRSALRRRSPVRPVTGPGLFGSLDRDALAAIGIDLGAVRARIESSFEPDALAHAGRAAGRGARPARLNLPRPRRDVPAWLMARWLRRRAAALEPIPLRAATGLWRDDGGTPVFIPFAPSAREFWEDVRDEARASAPRAPAPSTSLSRSSP